MWVRAEGQPRCRTISAARAPGGSLRRDGERAEPGESGLSQDWASPPPRGPGLRLTSNGLGSGAKRNLPISLPCGEQRGQDAGAGHAHTETSAQAAAPVSPNPPRPSTDAHAASRALTARLTQTPDEPLDRQAVREEKHSEGTDLVSGEEE